MSDPIKIMDEIEREVDSVCLPIDRILMKRRLESLRNAIEAQAEELAQARARIGRLEQALSKARDALYEYGQEQSRLDKSSAIAIADICTARLAESEPQSIPAVKAEALREYAAHKRQQAIEAGQGARRCRCNRMASNADAYADRIEREASHSSAKADEREAKGQP